MDKLKLRELVLEFLDAAIDSIQIQNAKGDEYLNKEEILAMWIKLPNCMLAPMFLGYVLALGHDINSFTPTDMDLAVQTALVGDDGVDFDWMGGCDATSKPH